VEVIGIASPPKAGVAISFFNERQDEIASSLRSSQ